MTQLRSMRALGLAAIVLAVLVVGAPRAAEAQHGRGGHGSGGRGPVVVSPGFYGYPYAGWYPYFGFGWGPYFGSYFPYGYAPPGGLDLNVAFIAGAGGIDVQAKPGQADVWVDGKYVAEARDLDGYPTYLWLAEGAHHVVVYKEGYARFEEDIEVQRGMVKQLKVKLEKGASEPPGQKPGKTTGKNNT